MIDKASNIAFCLWSVFLLTIPLKNLQSQNNTGNQGEIQKSQQIAEERGEVYFALPLNQIMDISSLQTTLSIEKIKNDTAYCWTNATGFQNILSAKYPIITLKQPEFPDPVKNMSPSFDSLFNWNVYPTWEQYDSLMHYFTNTYSSICQLISIGESVENRDLYVIKISDNVQTEEYEPEVMLSSTIHGNEITGYVLMLRLIDYLLKNYDTDSRINQLINHTVVWIAPLHNPDGTYNTGNNTIEGARRYNQNAVDLNRNFPDPAAGQHPDGNAWQTENIAFMNFIKSHRILLSANYHGGAEVVNYPWDTWYKRHPDNDWFIQISSDYTDEIFAHRQDNTYYSEFPNGITNGYDWYRITGGLQDYANYFCQNRHVTIEISDEFMPESSALPEFWESNYNSFLGYMEEVSHNMQGKVVDELTGEPVKAQITIIDYDEDNSWIYSDSTTGTFYRMLTDGNYSLSISAPGYNTKEIETIVYSYSIGYDLGDIELYPLTQPEITITSNSIIISLNSNTDTDIEVTLNDVQGRLVNPYIKQTVPPGSQSIQINLENLAPGIYFSKISIDGVVNTYKTPHL